MKLCLREAVKQLGKPKRGETAFEDAGSLCHGWSAMPVLYYRLLKDKL